MASSRKTGTNEQISSYNSGGGADYSSFPIWEVATDGNLPNAAESEVLEIEAGSHADGDTLDGATTNGSYLRIVRAASGDGHSAIPVTDGSVATFTKDGGGIHFGITEQNSQFQDLVFTATNPSGASYRWQNNTWNYGAFIACLGLGIGTRTNNHGFYGDIWSGDDGYFVNCLAHNLDRGFTLDNGWGDAFLYNCTAADNNTGFRQSDTDVYPKNCISEDNTTNWSGTFTKTTCTDDDGVVFNDAANDDFTLEGTDTAAIGNGTDLSADGTYPFDDDVLGTVRDDWDIGFHEYVVLEVSKSVSDNGSGSDALTSLLNSLSIGDTGAGNDVTPASAQSPFSVGDVATAAEAFSGIASAQVADSGAAADSLSAIIALSISDAVAGADVISGIIQGVLSVSDTGVAADSLSNILQGIITLNDNGYSVELISDIAQSLIAVNDSGAGADVPALFISILEQESGTGADALEAFAAISEQDSATGVDSNLISANISEQDSASSMDAISNLAQSIIAVLDVGLAADEVANILTSLLTISDNSEGLESLQNMLAALTATDTGAGSDSVLDVAANVPVQDSASGITAVSNILNSLISVSDTGAGVEEDLVLSLSLLRIVTDAATGTEGAVDISAAATVTDTASAIEAAAQILVNLAEVDSGAAVEAVNLLISLFKNVVDEGAGEDQAPGVAVDSIIINDAMAGIDVVSAILNSLVAVDTASAIDAIAQILISKLVQVSDGSVGSDSLQPIVVQAVVPDLATGATTITNVMASLSLIDAGVGSDVSIRFKTSEDNYLIEFTISPKAFAFSANQGPKMFSAKAASTTIVAAEKSKTFRATAKTFNFRI